MGETSFGQVVRERRDLLGLTQAELARRSGCATITVRKIEADDIRPSVQIAQRLAEALGVPQAEQRAFVRLARMEKPVTPIPEPPPELGEIGAGDLSGRAIRGYRLRERIGRGGVGVVYRALQASVERDVAVKIIRPRFANHPEFIRRFEAEARVVAALEHPHIVPLYDYWREPNIASLIMRYFKGGSLADKLAEKGALDLEEVGVLLEQVGTALHKAHEAGMIHRDVKPANILLDETGNAYLSDFGITKSVAQATEESLDGNLAGSPQYISPEQILAEPLQPQADVYSLGLMLYELLAGRQPFEGPQLDDYIQQQLYQVVPLLPDGKNGFPPALNAIISRATAKEPGARFPDVLALVRAYQQALSPYTGAGSIVTVVEPVENPFKGLRPFDETDAAEFYGRETLVQDLLSQLGQEHDLARFLAVVGSSGSGKSSAVRAGLLPALRRGGLPGSESWFITDMMPGSDPFRELERALLRVAVYHPGELLERLQRERTGLLHAAAALLPDDEVTELLLVVDQFEELFTLVEDEATRATFLDSLITAVLSPESRLRLVITLRADFADRPLQYVDFGELIRHRSAFVLPLTPDELEEAITRPVLQLGLRVEPELTATIIHDVGNQPGALPLLQYALTELFEQRQDGWLTLQAYQENGGVSGALARRADSIYEALPPAAQIASKQLFLRLISLSEGSEDTRRRVLRHELQTLQLPGDADSAALDRAIAQFGHFRLLTFDRDPATREPTVEVAHEALLREWGRLRRWLADSRADIRRQRLLSQQAREWRSAAEEHGLLLQGTHLNQFEGWLERTDIALTKSEKAFLTASLEARRRHQSVEKARRQRELETARQLADEQSRRAEEQSRAARRLRRLAAGLALVLLLTLGLGWLANDQRATAQASFVKAERIRLASQAQNALDRGEGGEVPALLALRSLALAYSPEADAALQHALRRGFSRQQYLGHTDMVVTALFSPNGRFVVTSSHDGSLRLWQAQTGEEIRQYIGHAAPVWRHTLSPDGDRILSGSLDGTARLWNTGTGAELQRFSHDGVVAAVDFSPDGRQALTSGGPVLYLWELATGAEVRRFEGHTDTVFTAVFSPDGRYLASAGQDAIVRLWETDSGVELRQLRGHTDWIGNADFSPDGRYLLTGSADRTARIWEVETGLELRRLVGHTDEVFSAYFSPDGRLVVTGGRDKTARLWDPRTGRELGQILGHTGGVFANFSPDGRFVVTGSEDRTARLWDLASATEPQTIIHSAGGHTSHHTAAAISADGQLVLADQGDGAIRLWRAPTSELMGQILLPGDSANSLTFSPDGSLALAASSNGAVYLIDARSEQEPSLLAGHSGDVWAGAFSPDGRLALTGADDGTVRLWEVVTGREMRQFRGLTGPVRSVAFSPDGRQILSGGDDELVLWRADSGQEVRRFDGQHGAALALTFAPDGQAVASGHDDHVVVLWDAETGRMLRQFVGHADQVSQVAFSPDGHYLLTGSADHTARLWDVHTGRLLHQYVGHESPLLTVGFSEDGHQVYTADQGNVYAWRTTLADLIDFTCKQLNRDLTAEERSFYNIAVDDATCPEQLAPAVMVEATWTPSSPAAVDVASLSMTVQPELANDLADGPMLEPGYTTVVDDITDPNDISPIAGSRAQLVTNDQGITLQVFTLGLTPGHAVTLWMVVFNNPENCSDGVCGPDDAFPPPGNTATGASVTYGAGQVIADDGEAYFAAHVPVGEEADPWPVGLLNPRTAEVHFILRDHGPAIPEIVFEQITTAGAGCNNFPPRTGDYTCIDVQAGFFRQQ
ncbi:MAG: protein kinase [Candidatus Promineifilaceae bacterium]|nr:protein kinase [Candidatus Promineifilaceae bacterium]